MRIGYARTSTTEQTAGYEAQDRDLTAAGCPRIYREQVSSVGDRPQLRAALDYLRDGDTLVVTKLDRLARSVQHLLEIRTQIEARGAHLQILDLSIDTSTATGAMLMTMIGAVAEFERRMMLERQREGIAKAKTEGKYKGRKPTAKAQSDEVLSLSARGVGPGAIAEQLGISPRSVHRILQTARDSHALA